MVYLNHITLSSGHPRRSQRADVSDGAIKALRPWLQAAIEHKEDYPLPGSLGTKDGFLAQVTVGGGALLCSVGRMQTGPLMTFGVAARSRQSGELWAIMCAQFGSAGALTAPVTPWCARALHPAFARQQDMAAWFGDFERCVAWAWIAGAWVNGRLA
jgi:hypothetical protein